MEKLRIGVVGLGTVGAQVLWQLSRRPDVEATGFEMFSPGHSRGAAGGENRLYRSIELGDPRYGVLVARANAVWQDLEAASGRELRTETGVLAMGAPDSEQMARGLRFAVETEAPHRVYDERELQARHPQFALDPGDIGLWDQRAGFIRPELSVLAAAGLAEENGAAIHRNVRVLDVSQGAGGPVVTTSEGAHRFDRVVVAAGGWTGKLLPDMRETIETRRLISSWHFGTTPGYLRGMVPFLRAEPTYCYGIPTADSSAVKIGLGYYDHLEVEDPDTVERVAQPDELVPFQEKIRRYLPGLDPEPMRTETYLETYTATRREWVAPHPEMADVLVLSGFSGHGFKLSTAIGEIGADLARGESPALDISFLSVGRDQAPTEGRVSQLP